MKHFVVLSLIVASMSMDFLIGGLALSASAIYALDLLIASASLILIIRIIVLKAWVRLPIVPVLLFLGFFYVAVAGAILNDLDSETTLAGFRYFFRSAPLFLMAYAFRIEEADLRRYLQWTAVILLLQTPLTVWQRFFSPYEWIDTGDVIVGTLGSSSSLAIFAAVSVAACVVALLDKRLSLTQTVVLSILFTIPSTLAETKATPFLVLIGVLAALFVRRWQLDLKRTVFAGLLLILLPGIFYQMYNTLYASSRGLTYVDLVFSFEHNYLYQDIQIAKGAFSSARPPSYIVKADERYREADERGVITKAGRVDSVIAPFRVLLPEHPEKLAIGIGVGNTSSSLGDGARYRELSTDLGSINTTVSHLLWETGIIGTILYIIFFLMVLVMAARCSRLPGFAGTFGAQMFVFTAVLIPCLLYTNYLFKLEILTLFTIFAGHLWVLSGSTRRMHGLSGPDSAASGKLRSGSLSAA